ncbi:PREDICTED: uncharacterized protein LOC109236148 [Nicotiana attenuata]|uniref:Uncharacterized protein n=1 Tax=Nicotiana attenuata TaxID=49451 RepID=A0A1J6HTF4_NICAT|nr:PREDICTED: uncharacterized protein LOC109236148 [Nicotiana attenuata]OIS95681.1 hypothetical protein A4A49_01165 [Nicotiana attenuata]
MATTSTSFLFSSPLLPSPFSPKRRSSLSSSSSRASSMTTLAMGREARDRNYYNGRIVDENLIILRKRIHEMKMIERNYEPPAEWMNWEKSLYTNYDSNICQAMGLLQSQLMDTRPSLVLGMVALIGLSVPTSTIVLLFHLIELTKAILAGSHIS